MLQKHQNRLKASLPTFTVIITLYILSRLIPQSEIERVITNAGPFAPLVFILVSLTSYIIAPLSGTPIAFVGFHLFGSKVVLYITISAFISFSTNFWIARKWGRPVVTKLAGDKALEKVDTFIMGKGYLTIFILRLFLGTYHDFISYASGLTHLKYIPYLIASTLGIVPAYFIWFHLAEQSTDALAFIAHTVILAFVFIGAFALWKKYQSKKKQPLEV